MDKVISIDKEKKILVFRKYKPSHFMFAVFAFVFAIDFITTVIALNFPQFQGMFFEMNPIAAWFQSFGVIGYMGAFIWSMFFLYMISLLICYSLGKIKNLDYRVNLYIFALFLFILFEGNVIANNIGLMAGG